MCDPCVNFNLPTLNAGFDMFNLFGGTRKSRLNENFKFYKISDQREEKKTPCQKQKTRGRQGKKIQMKF